MKIIILGASGMWGHQAYLALVDHFGKSSVACSLRKKIRQIPFAYLYEKSKIYEGIDWLNFEESKWILDDYCPDYIINCVGLTPRKYDTKDVESYHIINTEMPKKLATWVQGHQSRLIHFSTDCVFSGQKGNYTEVDTPDAKDTYGLSKALGEVQSDRVLTLRLSKIGRELEGKTEIVEWLLANKGKSVFGFTRAMYSGVTTNFMAKELVRIIEKYPNLSGLYQISSQPISKFDLLRLINEVYQANVDIEPKDDYVLDKTLNCELYCSVMGFARPQWADMIRNMKLEERVNYDNFR